MWGTKAGRVSRDIFLGEASASLFSSCLKSNSGIEGEIGESPKWALMEMDLNKSLEGHEARMIARPLSPEIGHHGRHLTDLTLGREKNLHREKTTLEKAYIGFDTPNPRPKHSLVYAEAVMQFNI